MRISDVISDVCSSDLRWATEIVGAELLAVGCGHHAIVLDRAGYQLQLIPCTASYQTAVAVVFQSRLPGDILWTFTIVQASHGTVDRQSGVSGKRVSVRVNLGGSRYI